MGFYNNHIHFSYLIMFCDSLNFYHENSNANLGLFFLNSTIIYNDKQLKKIKYKRVFNR